MRMDRKIKIAVIGGGAAGMMAAGTAVRFGADVTVFEHTDRLGKKLAITGKGRCNVTNDSSVPEILENVTKNPRFLFAAMNALPPSAVMSLFAGSEHGVASRPPRQGKVIQLVLLQAVCHRHVRHVAFQILLVRSARAAFASVCAYH